VGRRGGARLGLATTLVKHCCVDGSHEQLFSVALEGTLTTVSRRLLSACVLTATALSLPATYAFADSRPAEARAAAGCVSNADYAKLAIGQRMRYVRRVAGDDAQTDWRRWSNGANRYQERRYSMCTPTDGAHATLTTRFMWYRQAWRAMVVDTRVGPEPR
jgi:hypothetical protein